MRFLLPVYHIILSLSKSRSLSRVDDRWATVSASGGDTSLWCPSMIAPATHPMSHHIEQEFGIRYLSWAPSRTFGSVTFLSLWFKEVGLVFFLILLPRLIACTFPLCSGGCRLRDPKAAMGTKGLHLRRLTLVFFQYSWYCFLGCDDQDLWILDCTSKRAAASFI